MVNEYNDPGCRRRSELNLSGFLMRSAANGPGTRFVVWVQGCPIRCSGCFNPSSWSFSPVNVVTSDELADRILKTDDIEGVTFSGGEPFAQAGPVADVAETVRMAGLSVLTYSGYTYEQLIIRRDPAWDRLLSATDLLIAGPYHERETCPGPFMGSTNQQTIILNNRIVLEPPLVPPGGKTVEFIVEPDGTVTTTGFPEMGMVREISTRCRGV